MSTLHETRVIIEVALQLLDQEREGEGLTTDDRTVNTFTLALAVYAKLHPESLAGKGPLIEWHEGGAITIGGEPVGVVASRWERARYTPGRNSDFCRHCDQPLSAHGSDSECPRQPQ